MGNHEAHDGCTVRGNIAGFPVFFGVPQLRFCHQCDRVSFHDEPCEVHLRVGYAFRKAELVDLPETIEIGGAVLADHKVRASSLGLHWRPAQATPRASASSILSMATIATHSLLRFR